MINNSASQFLRTNVDTLSLSIVPSEPTHHVVSSTHQAHTWLDLFLVSSIDLVTSYNKSAIPFVAGHDLIEISFVFPRLERKTLEYWGRNFKSMNIEIFNKRILERLDFLSVALSRDAGDSLAHIFDTVVNKTTKVLIDELDSLAPQRLITIKPNRKPWVTQDIKLLMRDRDRAYRLAVNSGRASDIAKYRGLRSAVSNSLDSSRANFIASDLGRAEDSKSRWAALRKLGLAKRSLPSPLKTFSSSALLGHYSSVSGTGPALSDEDINKVLSHPLNLSKPIFSFSEVSLESITKCLSSVKSKSTGPDGISAQVLRMASKTLTLPIKKIIDFSLTNSIFPTDWKRAFLCPLAKVKNMSSPSDTRPIAKLCEISKILERSVHSQFLTFLTENNLLCKHQAGFRPNHSTQSALLNILEDVREAIDRRKITALLLFDFSKAFDSVPHHLLLLKLRKLNCDDRVIYWFASYLRGRSQSIQDDTGCGPESWAAILTGVPQGSVLGPLLFLVFINDLPSVLSFSSYTLFADDFQLYYSFYPDELSEAFTCINQDINALVKWSTYNGLKLNASKTQAIILGSLQYVTRVNLELEKPDCPLLVVDGSRVNFSPYIKNLGILIDQTLCWDRQVSATVSRVHNTLRSLRLYRRALNQKLRKELIESLVFPLFDYCCLTYNDLNQQQNLRLHRALNACVRFVFSNIGHRERVTPYRIELGWLSVASRRKYFLATTAFSLVSSTTPDYLSSRFTRINLDISVRQSSRRPQRVLICPPLRTNALQQSFVNLGTCLLNELSGTFATLHLFNSNDLVRFRRHTRDFLLQHDREEWSRDLSAAI